MKINTYYFSIVPFFFFLIYVYEDFFSGILLRVNEVSTGPTMYSPQAKTNFTNFFQGLTNELADKQDEEGCKIFISRISRRIHQCIGLACSFFKC